MKSFHINLLGQSEPYEMVVEMPVDAARARLEMALVEAESWGQALFQSNRRYTGTLRGNAFDLIALWRNRRFRPTLTGRFEPLDNGTTRIHFEVHPDSVLWIGLLLPGFLFLTAAIAGFFSNVELPWLPILSVVLPLLLAGSGLNLWFARRESSHLLHFFVELYRRERVA
jgi:hypothetical protein